ncbi:uncharacterized protein EI90DRAFT_3286709 [Cantharellus anzutake]|uniref:uncharacterized protein n=1 Tax=Cantharellus anzutake TaxID=1750568 RepID=UPI0019037F33|nr:uncharacterized protein EI90DRAFT_3286709 [Cantharellus anzutake]KAF8337898.1 hypothetical protein EI90DRAFT_3286709 [Cantharellus anzutake]
MLPAKVFLVSAFVQTVLYGAYSVLCVTSIWVILTKKTVNRWIAVVCLIIFGSSTLYLATVLQRLKESFIVHSNPFLATFVLSDSGHVMTKLAISIGVTNIAATSILIWRIYYVWNCSWWPCAIPCVSLLLWIAFHIKAVVDGDYGSGRQIILTFAFWIATNTLSTCLLGIKIWWERWRIRREYGLKVSRTQQFHYNLVSLVVNSGVIYTILIIILFILIIVDNPSKRVLAGVDCQVPGIVTSLIVLYTGLAKPGSEDSIRYDDSRNNMTGPTLIATNPDIESKGMTPCNSANTREDKCREAVPPKGVIPVDVGVESGVELLDEEEQQMEGTLRNVSLGGVEWKSEITLATINFPDLLEATEENPEDLTNAPPARPMITHRAEFWHNGIPELKWTPRELAPVHEDMEPGSSTNVRQLGKRL